MLSLKISILPFYSFSSSKKYHWQSINVEAFTILIDPMGYNMVAFFMPKEHLMKKAPHHYVLLYSTMCNAADK